MTSEGGTPISWLDNVTSENQSVVYIANLGPQARLRVISAQMSDLSTVVAIGEIWGSQMSRAIAADAVPRIFTYPGQHGSPVDIFRPLGFGKDEISAVRGFLEQERVGNKEREHLPWSVRPVLQHMIEASASRYLGNPVNVSLVSYRNPLELVLIGSGSSLAGVVLILSLIRDWSGKRQFLNAKVQQERAKAEKLAAEADAAATQARSEISRANLQAWLVDQITRTGPLLPTDVMADHVHTEGLEAIERLSHTFVSINTQSIESRVSESVDVESNDEVIKNS